MEFFKNIEKDIKRYGRKGDQTLECIGINFFEGVFHEYKCYRFMQKKLSDLKIPNNPFENHFILKRLDIQKNCDKNLYRIAYKVDLSGCQEKTTDILQQQIIHMIQQLKYDIDIANIILDINTYIKVLLQTEIEPVCVLGGKIDCTGKIHALKVYYQLKIYKWGGQASIVADTEKYIRIIEFMENVGKIEKEQSFRIKDIFRSALENNFEPMMMGIDIGRNIHKIKYYFHIKEEFFRENDNVNSKNFFDSEKMEELIQKLDSFGLEIKGFTIPYSNCNKNSMINLYFFES